MAAPLEALGGEVVEVLVGRRAHRFQIDFVIDQDGYAGQRSDLALGAAGGASGGLRAIRGVGGRKCCNLTPLGSTALHPRKLATACLLHLLHVEQVRLRP